jgi:hypothetical protein
LIGILTKAAREPRILMGIPPALDRHLMIAKPAEALGNPKGINVLLIA